MTFFKPETTITTSLADFNSLQFLLQQLCLNWCLKYQQLLKKVA